MMKLLLLVAILANVTLLVSSASCGGDPNAKPGCGTNCGKRCSTYQIKNPICSDICNTNGCDCKNGYVFDDNLSKCVKPKDCTPTCQVNEVFSNCTNGGCDARNCTQLGNPVPCVKLDPASCKKGCVCIDGYLRAENGTCVPISQCPSCGGDKNKKAGCGVYCNRHCSDIGQEPKSCIKICYPNACDCREGYYLNSNGKCVKPDQCDTTSCGGDPNAKPGCGTNCGKRCSTYQIKNPICSDICNTNGCDCKNGYVFDDNLSKCVKPKDCTPTCQVNEVFSNCTNGGCDARNCTQLGNPVPCVKLDPASCKKGCVCIDGYLRAENGTCVPISQCPSCGGDKNKRPGCGVYCNRHCSDIGQEPKSCIAICYSNACDCREGYYLNSDGKCVKPDQCDTTSCGGDPNAKPGCGSHCGNTCSTYNKPPVACPLICLVNGCDCKENYVYDTNTKKCVLPKDCSKSPNSSTTTLKSTTTTTSPSSEECSDEDEQDETDD